MFISLYSTVICGPLLAPPGPVRLLPANLLPGRVCIKKGALFLGHLEYCCETINVYRGPVNVKPPRHRAVPLSLYTQTDKSCGNPSVCGPPEIQKSFLLLSLRELILPYRAQRAFKILRHVLPLCPGSDSAFRISGLLVIFPAADITYILHIHLSFQKRLRGNKA